MIHIVLGTKAQLIKMAPVMARLQARGIEYRFIFTGQHRATTQEMLEEFGLKRPDVTLYSGDDVVSVPQMALWMGRVLWRFLTRRRDVFGSNPSGVVLVHGDTLSTLLGAVMGRLAGLRVGHVESGLRSRNLLHPFPEELTRFATFRLSHTLFCPGAWAIANVRHLRRELVDTRANTLADTVRMALGSARRRDHVPDAPFGIVSLHRYENIFKRGSLESIVTLLERVAANRLMLFILHRPTERQLRALGLYDRLTRCENIELRPRYTYCEFLPLLERADFVVTDGGSVQEETSYLGVPCLLMRRTTERREGLGENVVLSNYDPEVVEAFVSDFGTYRRPAAAPDGSPSEIIVDAVACHA